MTRAEQIRELVKSMGSHGIFNSQAAEELGMNPRECLKKAKKDPYIQCCLSNPNGTTGRGNPRILVWRSCVGEFKEARAGYIRSRH
jgi:hypothetical protein